MAKIKILRESQCDDPSRWGKFGYGGYFRVAQTDEILRLRDVEVANVQHASYFPRKERFKAWLWLWRRGWLRGVTGWSQTQSAVHCFLDYRQIMRAWPHERVLLLESCLQWPVYAAGEACGWAVIPMLASLDSLWPGRCDLFTGAVDGCHLDQQIEKLSRSSEPVCISREEQWVLANRKIKSSFLPYFPDTEREQSLETIRRARVSPSRGEFLLFATYNNSDSRDSFDELAGFLRDHKQAEKIVIHVVGYGSEELEKSQFKDSPFVFHGTVDPEKLMQLQCSVSALLLHNTTGVGSITRIPDMLVAGVPVIATPIAARSAHEYQGVYVYDTPDHLRELLVSEIPEPPKPLRPVRLEQEFADKVYGYARKRPSQAADNTAVA